MNKDFDDLEADYNVKDEMCSRLRNEKKTLFETTQTLQATITDMSWQHKEELENKKFEKIEKACKVQ